MKKEHQNQKQNKKQIKIAVIDFETDPFQYGLDVKPFAAGHWDGETYSHFWGDDCVIQLIDYLKDESEQIIYAHNGGKFDFFFMLEHFDEKMQIINGRIAQATLFDGKHELRDSYLILPMPLKTHGKKVISYRKMRKQFREKYKQQILEYLRFDCTSLYTWVEAFRRDYGGGLTLAGTAFKQLKITGYPIVNTFENFDGIFRPFYFGGRVECFKVGAFYGEHIYVDINSAYPFAMMSKHWQGSNFSQTKKLPKHQFSYFAIIKAVSHGALPIKTDKGRLIFPNDAEVREYKVTGWEIQAGLDTGTLDIVEIVAVFTPLFTCDFKAYVDKFFTLKRDAEQRGDSTQRTFAKLMLNSAYGKFGQDGRQFEEFAITPFGTVPESGDYTVYSHTETGHTVHHKPAPVDRFFNVATAASITGCVRATLWRAICASETPLYCDTDAIMARSFTGTLGEELGQWSVEALPVEIFIAQKKMYAVKMRDGSTKKACKGVRLTFEQIKNGVINKENIVFKKPSPAFSLKYGTRFFSREINFKNIG
jgi:DNA polymerase type B, organellar and viral